jgi:hypothetical protein
MAENSLSVRDLESFEIAIVDPETKQFLRMVMRRGLRFTHVVDSTTIEFALHCEECKYGPGQTDLEVEQSGDRYGLHRWLTITHLRNGSVVGRFDVPAGASAIAEAKREIDRLPGKHDMLVALEHALPNATVWERAEAVALQQAEVSHG